MTTPSKDIRLVCIVFFLSGCSALIFETVWFQVASRVLGSSIWSAAAVLTAFMSGLALGNALMAHYGHRIRDNFRFYIGIEITIGLTGVMTVWVLPAMSPYIAKHVAEITGNITYLNGIRFIIAFSVLVVPALAMGTTLPVLQKVIHDHDKNFSSSLGKLYGWNTIGAVSGVLLAEFVLIKFAGLKSTAFTACALNLIAALLILKKIDTGHSVTENPGPEYAAGKLTTQSLRYLFAPFLTGLALLALEVVWFRYLLMAHGGTSITFSIMLATVLAGIGIGGLIAPMLEKHTRQNLSGLALRLTLLASIATLCSFLAYSALFEHFTRQIMVSYVYFSLAGLLLMLPVCIISGLLFPLYGEMLFRSNNKLTLSSGSLTLVNTVGAAAGSAIASFILLPNIGIEKSILTLSSIYLLAGISWQIWNNDTSDKRANITIVISSILFFSLVIISSGTVEKTYKNFATRTFPNWSLIKIHEGLNETIGYFEMRTLGKPVAHRLVTNSHSMSGTATPSRRYMKLYVYMPYIFQQSQIKSVLQISYGVGNTAEAVVRLDSVEHYDVVDLSPDILELSAIAHATTGIYPLKDPRTRVHIEDGRFFLQTTSHLYDLITAEPPPPKHAGIINLYSTEYFSLIKNKLTDNGMVTYWLPVHSLDTMDSLTIIRGFCDVFPDCSLWNGAGLDFMLVGTKSGLKQMSTAQLESAWKSPIQNDLVNIGLENPGQLLATFLADNELLANITKGVSPASDNYPQRISPENNNAREYSVLYASLLDIDRRRQHIENSRYMKSIVTEKSLQSATQNLYVESAITARWAPIYKDVLIKNQLLLDVISEVASRDNHWFALITLLDSSPTEIRLLDEAGSDQTASDEYRKIHIKNNLAQGKYKQAANDAYALFMKQVNAAEEHREAYIYYLLAMGLDGRATSANLQHLAIDDPVIVWYRKRFKLPELH